MADTNTAEVVETDKGKGHAIVDHITKIGENVQRLEKGLETLATEVKEKSQPQTPWMSGAPGMIIGESPNNSRSFSFSRLALGLQKRLQNDDGWRDVAKSEIAFASRFGDAVSRHSGASMSMAVPIGVEFLSEEYGTTALKKEWSEMTDSTPELDLDEFKWMADQLNLRKDMTFRNTATGGTLVDFPAQGEVIELLRSQSLFERVPGVRNMQLPQQGSIRFPKVTSGVTIGGYAESETVTESTPGTSEVTMEARKYAGLVELTEEFFKFATSVSADSFIRGEMTADMALKIDQDIIYGPGGKRIQGIINYAGITTHTATTVGANGNTLEPRDLDALMAKIADADAPINTGNCFFAMRNQQWASLKHRADSTGRPVFQIASESYGNRPPQQTYSGHPVLNSTQIPNDRVKGSGTDLTFVLCGIGSEMYIGRAGAMEIVMTNSHASNFANGVFTLRGVHYCDMAPRHEVSFGIIDDLLANPTT